MRTSEEVRQEAKDLERFCKVVQAVPDADSFLENYAYIAACYGRWVLEEGPVPSMLLHDMLNYALRGNKTLSAWSGEVTLDDDPGDTGGMSDDYGDSCG